MSDKLPHVEVHESMCKFIGDMAKENEALKARIKRLEEAGDEMGEWLANSRNLGADPFLSELWIKAKEDKL